MGSQELKKGDPLRVKMGQMGSSMSDVKEKDMPIMREWTYKPDGK